MVAVRFVPDLNARDVVNLTSPRYLPEVTRAWAGRHPWHEARYEPVRDLMERIYVDGFAAHFELLRESVEREGVRNPVMLECGRLRKRSMREVPPDRRTSDMVVSEYLGGSRLFVAQALDLTVPAIVNDHVGRFDGHRRLRTEDDVRACFIDQPAVVRMRADGVYANNLPYVHLPEAMRYTMGEQSRIRRKVVAEVKEAVREWLKAEEG